MNDQELKQVVKSVLNGGTDVRFMDEKKFLFVLGGIARHYNSRVWNQEDSTGKMNAEWNALTTIFERVQQMVAVKIAKNSKKKA